MISSGVTGRRCQTPFTCWSFLTSPILPIGRRIGCVTTATYCGSWEDKGYGEAICGNCAIKLVQEAEREIKEHEQKGEKTGHESLRKAIPDESAQTAREEAKRVLRHAFYDDGAGANGRTCQVVNFFKCPYRNERDELIKSGRIFRESWNHLEWYERHWYNNHISNPAEDEKKWYHWNEPKTIDLTNPDDVVKSLEDGRYDRAVWTIKNGKPALAEQS